jgi:gamma-glutamylcyclotransferase (GGCT)/AIG2-like uncharacterized protein YtfP
MPAHLFLYGTLLPDLAPAELRDVVARLRHLGPAHVPGVLYDLGDFPGALVDPASPDRVVGRVFRLPDDPGVLAALDAHEGFEPADPAGSLFLRVERTVTLPDGGRLACWVYAYNRDPGQAPRVPHGDYARWRARQK